MILQKLGVSTQTSHLQPNGLITTVLALKYIELRSPSKLSLFGFMQPTSCRSFICIIPLPSATLITCSITFNSMKNQKSSYSLHTPAPFQQHPLNTITYHKHSSTLKQFNTNPRESNVVYNARGRLNACINQLHELQGQIEEINARNKSFVLELAFLREEYYVKKAGQTQNELSNAVRQLRKKVTIGNRSDLLKFDSLNQIVGRLSKNQKEIRGKVGQIQERVRFLQEIMGNGQPLSALSE